MKSRSEGALLAALVAAGVCVVVVLVRAAAVTSLNSYDTYAFHYPIMLLARDRVWGGGHGLLWNDLQSCGAPFLGVSSNALLYPPHALFLFLPPQQALLGILLFNLTVAGVSAYLLGRALGVGPMAAFAGALAFELGNAMVDVTTWTPVVAGAYAWFPAALLCCERILQAPSLRRGIALGVVLALAVLPGHPQVVFFIYQLVALRVLWELVSRRAARRPAVVLTVGFALVLCPLLAAAQLVPAVEAMRESVRSGSLSLRELSPQGFLNWARMSWLMLVRSEIFNPFLVVPCVVAAAGLFQATTRRVALFYASAALLYFGLSFGPNTPLYGLYLKLPLGGLFREPGRFNWIAAFCLAVLVALGLDAVVRRADERRRFLDPRVVAAALALGGLFFMYPRGLLPQEWGLGVLAVAGCLIAAVVPRRPVVGGAMILLALALNLLSYPQLASFFSNSPYLVTRTTPTRRLLPDADLLFARAPLFADLRSRMTAQDRFYLVGSGDYSLQQKTGALFGLPSLHDYDAQPARRYSEYFLMMRVGRFMTSLLDAHYALEGFLPIGFKRRLLNLAAGRYLVVAEKSDTTDRVLDPAPALLATYGDVRVYENPEAFPRASWLPYVAIERDPRRLLQRLANGPDELQRVALVEEMPPSGFTGEAGRDASGMTEFLVNQPEHLAIHVEAAARGFLFLSDQYAPGWSATVNGVPVAIMRANYAFRLVEVPAGESIVEFRYTPASVRIGAWVSGLTAALVVLALVRTRQRRAAGDPGASHQ